MRIGIVGLGLIGGSLAKAVKEKTGHTVYGFDLSDEVAREARDSGAVDGLLPPGGITGCDIVLIALYPSAVTRFVSDNADAFGEDAIVVDCCGVKTPVCGPCFKTADEHGFTFVGGHPMAGTERSGFGASRADLFAGASMILTPREGERREVLRTLEDFFKSLGFAGITYSTPAEHDDIIAYTSQLAHVVSSAYVKSPQSKRFMGFSAGSFKDMTRVAYLNEDMWSELFCDNAGPLVREIEEIIGHLSDYSQALRHGDRERLRELLLEGKLDKLSADEKEKSRG